MISAQTAAMLIALASRALDGLGKVIKVVQDGLQGKCTPEAVKESVAKLLADIAKTDADIDAKLRAKFRK